MYLVAPHLIYLTISVVSCHSLKTFIVSDIHHNIRYATAGYSDLHNVHEYLKIWQHMTKQGTKLFFPKKKTKDKGNKDRFRFIDLSSYWKCAST
jgi:hypothetical protein